MPFRFSGIIPGRQRPGAGKTAIEYAINYSLDGSIIRKNSLPGWLSEETDGAELRSEVKSLGRGREKMLESMLLSKGKSLDAKRNCGQTEYQPGHTVQKTEKVSYILTAFLRSPSDFAAYSVLRGNDRIFICRFLGRQKTARMVITILIATRTTEEAAGS